MANFTPNFNLKKPLGAEFFNVEDQNGNMDIIDSKLKDMSRADGIAITDSVATALGLPSTASVAEGLLSITPPLIAKYETAGAYTWTAPDLLKGKNYRIGVVVVGGGGAGGSHVSPADGSSKTYIACGGASGYSCTTILTVAPFKLFQLVVGRGGQGKSNNSGENGESSTFNENVANGGDGGYGGGQYGSIAEGARTGSSGDGIFGVIYAENTDMYRNFLCINRFDMTEILGSGGGISQSYSYGVVNYNKGGKNPVTNLGGGNSGNVGENGTEPGCGGGASKSPNQGGSGADGAVYIYFLGVIE